MLQKIKFESINKNNVLLELMNFSQDKAYYLLFSHREYNIEVSIYKSLYKELEFDSGIIKLQNNNIDLSFIYDMFFEFQNCSLIISDSQDINTRYSFDKIYLMNLEDRNKKFGGIEIIEIGDNFIILFK
jgi:hypothetical protein